MKATFIFLFLMIGQFSFAQQYNSLVIEKDNVDGNNKIYKTGSVFVFDYEIVIDSVKWKLKTNNGMASACRFDLVDADKDSIGVNKLHLLVKPVISKERTNKNQTEILYLEDPVFSSISSTGLVENEQNVWLHPMRSGFFGALETCPFPYVKLPLQMGQEWSDEMKISNSWSNKLWGEWRGKLRLIYHYKVCEQCKLQTSIGSLNCYVIKSTAISKIGTAILKSYYSEQYGFVRMEYEMVSGIKVNIWLEEVSSEHDFTNMQAVLKYVKERKDEDV
ncbi:hypothetical protein GCQ56_15430 [Marinifilum sp. N1E240]|uniref:hypothetical protein n=1 Tax=Marinifilum sp. N1E240 TaxID=2608082 RepID=UPI00128E5128|nr:hypothetical protein [Marinifilum sp. N1E240]MPQ48395.1 hypothetical protein [Marinifilum sp. N1E240]